MAIKQECEPCNFRLLCLSKKDRCVVEMAKNLTIDSIFEDDHLPCIRFHYGDRCLELWWTSHSVIGALQYADESPRAWEHVGDLIELINDTPSFKHVSDEDETPQSQDESQHTDWGWLLETS